jgi:hypothetical protein
LIFLLFITTLPMLYLLKYGSMDASEILDGHSHPMGDDSGDGADGRRLLVQLL